VLANGVDVESTYLRGSVRVDLSLQREDAEPFEGVARWSGSSFAAALVSGAIAARTVPGRTSARAAWEALLREFPDDGVRPQQGGEGPVPRFLPLLGRAPRPQTASASA